MRLDSANNGLANVIEKESSGNAYVDYNPNNLEVSIFWWDSTKAQRDRLKVIVMDYIDKTMLQDSYSRITIYSE